MLQTIRRIEPDEIPEIRSVINSAFQTVADEFDFTRERSPTFPAYIQDDVLRRQMDNGLILYGGIVDNRYVGSIGIRNAFDHGRFVIERLAVIPGFRHKKIGSQLMQYATEEIIRNHGACIQVEIVNENLKLKKWYLDQGFVEERIDHYDHLPFSVGILVKRIGQRH